MGIICLDWGNLATMDLESWAPMHRKRRFSVDIMRLRMVDFSAGDPARLFHQRLFHNRRGKLRSGVQCSNDQSLTADNSPAGRDAS